MTDSGNNTQPSDVETGFVAHLLELRDRLLRIVLVITAIFICLFPFANSIYSVLAEPLLVHMPSGSSMIAVEVISPFLTPLKMALYASIFLGMPYLLYQTWSFVAPGLYMREKRLAVPLLISSIILFYAGVAFAYFVVFPLVFQFLISVAPEGVAVMTDINKYLDFVLALFFAFGLAFEVPVATIILIATGITDADSLVKKRPYIIVGAFVFGMFLTPPDVISQIMLALPMWMLFELGIIMSRVLLKPSEDGEEEADSGNNNEGGGVSTVGAAATDENNNTSSKVTDTGRAPKGYSETAYPDDYEPLSEDELEAELDGAEAWEEENEDDEDDNDEEQEDTTEEDKDNR